MNADTARSPVVGAAGVGDNVLLTGSTGFLGAEILKRILRGHPRTHVSLVVRSTFRETANERIERQLVRSFGQEEASRYRDRVEVVEGDISHRGLGIDLERDAKLLPRIDHVIHCAAAVQFGTTLEVARRDNTEGTRNVLTFAERLAHLGRLDYIGTAYVAGKRSGRIMEDELDVGQEFSNSYEQTKMESEKLVRAFAERFPTAIYRPSIIVGNSKTGEAGSFQGFYQVLQFYRQIYGKGIIIMLPADPNTIVDIVPIDYVVDAIFSLMHSTKSIGGCFHVASGPGSTCTLDELMQITAKFTHIKPPPYISREAWFYVARPLLKAFMFWDKRREAVEKAERDYMPHVWSKLIFDKTNTNAVLNGTGIAPPHPTSYFVKLLEYQAKTLKLV
jgi:thioester reductase-like protein